MAYVQQTLTETTGPFGWLRALGAGLAGRYTRWSVYRATYDELSALTDRDLADLGIHRADIADVAREAARTA